MRILRHLAAALVRRRQRRLRRAVDRNRLRQRQSLAAELDAMGVETKWIAGERVDWRSGLPERQAADPTRPPHPLQRLRRGGGRKARRLYPASAGALLGSSRQCAERVAARRRRRRGLARSCPTPRPRKPPPTTANSWSRATSAAARHARPYRDREARCAQRRRDRRRRPAGHSGGNGQQRRDQPARGFRRASQGIARPRAELFRA